MRTLELSDGWVANHNGDFSGEVLIRKHKIDEKGEHSMKVDVDVEIPFDVLKGVVAEYVRLRRLIKLESATADEILLKPQD